MKTLLEWTGFCTHQHDVVCNQKYDRTLPYSFHLGLVFGQAKKFSNLLIEEKDSAFDRRQKLEEMYCGCWGHDLIEDARLTYNDIVAHVGPEVAEIIFLCTEMRGRSRKERKNEQFYADLGQNEIAVFVKLCDIIANSLYSALTNSFMLGKAKDEWPFIKEKLSGHAEKFHDMFAYLDHIYKM